MPDINMQHFGELQRNQHSIDVEIDASQITSAQQDFPMMLETPNSVNSALNVVAINELGEQLPTEIEGVANNKNWVHLKDSVQDVVNHKMKVFYGGSGGIPAADSTYGSQAVWDSNYKAVFHMNNDPNGDVANSIKDSTLNSNHGTPSGSMTSADLVDGNYGKGIDFDGVESASGDCIDVGTIAHTGENAVIMKIKMDSITGNFNNLYGEMDASNYWGRYNIRLSTATNLQVTWNNTLIQEITLDDVTNGNEHIIIISRTGTDGNMQLNIFQNGVLKSSTTEATLIGSYTSTTSIAQWGVYRTANYFDGVIIEVRDLSPKSNNYYITTSKNLNNPTASGTDPFYKSISKEHNFAESLQSLGRAG